MSNSVQYSNGDFFFNEGDNDHSNNGRINQYVFNENRMKLLMQVKKASSILDQLNNRNGAPSLEAGGTQKSIPINCSLSDLEILQLNLQLDNHKRTKIMDLIDVPAAKNGKESSPSLDTIGSNDLTSTLFDKQVQQAKQHLVSLEKRVMDSNSKVFITGDLNSGKSSLCNALLKRHVLPTDQLPCTNVFVEVLDTHFNKNKQEEVHAIPLSKADNVSKAIKVYNQHDLTSYELFKLGDLEDLVTRNDKWSFIVVYLNDSQPGEKEKSLLHNGIADIALIDSPGLNMDDLKTTEVFSREEEIDLVVFVVSAENQLTLSGKDFVTKSSKEKQFIFFVVNKFNAIKNKERCKQLILSQIKDLSPLTYKQSDDFVHFVSSEDNLPSEKDNGNGDDDHRDDGQDPDFENLRESLKNFVLKKRSISKLLPAHTYLSKLLHDIYLISKHNKNICQEQYDDVAKTLKELKPMVTSLEKESTSKSRKADLLVEKTINEIYDTTRQNINKSIEETVFPVYTGISEMFEYINDTIKAIKSNIVESVNISERFAKEQIDTTVQEVYQLAEILPADRPVFNKDLMFQQRRHMLSKQFDVSFETKDLFQPSWGGFVNFLQWGASVDENAKLDSYAGNVNKYFKNPSLIFNSKIPSLLVYSLGGAKLIVNVLMYGASLFSWSAMKNIGSTVVLIGGSLGCAYLINDLPRALPQNLIEKYKGVLEALDYAHANSSRVAKVCRQVLKTPASEITKKFDEKLINMNQKKFELNEKMVFYKRNLTFFDELKNKASRQSAELNTINLDVE